MIGRRAGVSSMLEPPLTDHAAACEEAAHAIRAAFAIIADAAARDRDAAVHLARAWSLLAAARGRTLPDPRAGSVRASDIFESTELESLNEHQRRTLDLLLPTILAEARSGPTRGPWHVDRRVLLRHARTLGLMVGVVAPPGARPSPPRGRLRRARPPLRRSVRPLVLWGGGLTLAILTVAIWGLGLLEGGG